MSDIDNSRLNNVPDRPTSTDDYYTANAEKWTTGHNNENFWEHQLNRFQQILPEGIILEIGAGGGRDAKLLIERGYGYVGIEPSGMIETAQANNPEALFHNIHVEEMNAVEAFDGFWASASLLHHPKHTIDNALQKIFAALKTGGVGYIAVKKHSDDLPDQRMVPDKYGERFFAFWLMPEFKEVLERNGFEIVYDEEVLKGSTTWLTLIVRKPYININKEN